MVIMSSLGDKKNIEMQLREGGPGVFPVSVVDVESLPKRLEWEQDGVRYQAYLMSPKYRIEQMTKQT